MFCPACEVLQKSTAVNSYCNYKPRTTLECMHEYMSSHGHRGIQWSMDFFEYKLTQQILPMIHFTYSTLELTYSCTRLLKASCFDQSHESVESLAKKRSELFDLEHASMTCKSILKTKHRLMINGSPHQRPPPFYSDPYNKYQHGHLQHTHVHESSDLLKFV